MTKVLVIDDDDLNRKILDDMLEEEGFEVIMAEDGLQGLETLRATPDVDVILLDRMMPRMTGMEFMQQFRRRDEWRHIPVIMQTAANQPKDVMEGNQTGIYFYLTKPYEQETVISLVNAALDEKKRAELD
ncbi:MAG: response regulator [Rickettsiales bacterium]|nr:response regulator [Rickettsiales bacterium]